MATMRLITVKNISKFLLNESNFIQIRCKSSTLIKTPIGRVSDTEEAVTTEDPIRIRCQSSNYLKTCTGAISHVPAVVTIEDNSMYFAWHPTTEFPYEYSRPIPQSAIQTSTLLKDEAIQKSMAAFTKKHPLMATRELERLTYTSKHVWRPPPVIIRKLALIRRELYKEKND